MDEISPGSLGRFPLMDVINVKDFGARGDGSITPEEETLAIRDAATAIPDQGGILYFPPGLYRVVPGSGIALKARTWVLGAGAGSVISADGKVVIFLALGVSEIRISSLSFLIDVMESPDNDYTTAVDFEGGASDIMVDSCRFEAVNVPAGDHITLHAVLAKGVKNFRVINNRIYQMQIKTAADAVATGFNVMGPAVIANNYISRPRNWGITAVHFTDPTEFLDMIIANNIIEDPAGEGGIAVGTDSDEARIESLRRIVIQGNIIKGVWTNEGAPANLKQAIGIFVRAARESEQILVEGNVIRKDGNTPPLELLGIKIDVCTRPTTVKLLTVANNTIRHTELPAIQVAGDQELEGFVISGNTLEQTGGILIGRGIIRDGIVASNVVYRGGGLHLRGVREGDRIGPILVRDNIFKSTLSGGSDGIRLDTSVSDTIISADVIGNRCSNNQYGIHEIGVDEGGQGAYDTRYLDNDVRDNAIAGVRVTPTAVVRNNRGWVTENKGRGIIAPNETGVQINHGLDVRPRRSDITITATNNPMNVPGHIWVSAVDDARFTVSCANAPGNPGLTVGWHIIVL